MPILALGVSYRRAPVELLERLSIAEEGQPKAYKRLSELESVREAVLLSTCNRVEVYAEVQGYHQGFQDLKRFLAEATEVSVEEIAEPLYAHYEDQAADHLFSVASGLDSMVLGEPQVHAQVRAAFRRAEDEGSIGPELRALFGRAVRAGRRVRAETSVGASPSAFVDAGLDLAATYLGGLEGRTAVVVGSGEMGALAVQALGERGASAIVVLSRRRERAEKLAGEHGATPGPIEELDESLSAADVVISSTGSTGPVIGVEALRSAGERQVFVMDLAVPRDVDPAAASLPGVRLADIDDLAPVVEERRGDISGDVGEARRIVESEVRRYSGDRRAQRLAPLIRALHQMGDDVRAEELKRLAPRLSKMSARDREAVEALSQRIVARLLHEPTVRLKDLAGRRMADDAARSLADLFGLKED
ncbi:MAG: glutamyl-tRNA reductase [Actinomycetota bacterium]